MIFQKEGMRSLPLSEKVRIEIYIPDRMDKPVYRQLLHQLNDEFTIGFGGCTVIHGLIGSYSSQSGTIIPDRVDMLFIDLAYPLDEHFDRISQYCDNLRLAIFNALNEEAILITVSKLYWSI